MATHASAVKRHRQSLKRKKRNQKTRSKLHLLKKKVFGAKNKEEAQKHLRELVSAFHKAAQKHLVHANKAARNISRLTKFVNKIA